MILFVLAIAPAANAQYLESREGTGKPLQSLADFTPSACDTKNGVCNSSVSESITTTDCTSGGRYFDQYRFTLNAGQATFSAEATGGGLDTYLQVYDSTGQQLLIEDDDSGPGTDALLVLQVNVPGTYIVVVTSYAPGRTGSYRLTANCNSGTPPPGGTTCQSSSTALCLNQSRFRVQVSWRTSGGQTGNGQVVPTSSADSGLFWFFDQNNWELLIKVLNGCPVNNRYWVFGAATTDVGYTITVTDTRTGAVKTYTNPVGQASPAITDSGAFATCP